MGLRVRAGGVSRKAALYYTCAAAKRDIHHGTWGETCKVEPPGGGAATGLKVSAAPKSVVLGCAPLATVRLR